MGGGKDPNRSATRGGSSSNGGNAPISIGLNAQDGSGDGSHPQISTRWASDDMVEVFHDLNIGGHSEAHQTGPPPSSLTIDATAAVSSSATVKARLLFSKTGVYLHPTQQTRDNIPGYLGLAAYPDQREEKIVLFWIPEALARGLRESDAYEEKAKVEATTGPAHSVNAQSSESSPLDDYVMVTLPLETEPSATEQYEQHSSSTSLQNHEYAFAIPLGRIYSFLVYPPSLTTWYGNVTINLLGGASLSSLYFHDDESASTVASIRASEEPNFWGATAFFKAVSSHCEVLQSQLEPRLYLVNPSRMDRDVHQIQVDEDREDDPLPRKPYPPTAEFPANPNELPAASSSIHSTRTTFLSSFSQLTSSAKLLTANVLSHPFAKPLVPHLPAPVQSLVNAPGEWETSSRRKSPNGETEFESARIYLARWARIVAEEGERARKREAAAARQTGAPEEKTDLGIFEVIRSASVAPTPSITRVSGKPVTEDEFLEWHEKGFDEGHLRGEVFRRGINDDGEARKWIWEVLLGTVPWELGLGLSNDESWKLRERHRDEHRLRYETLKEGWKRDTAGVDDEKIKEEWHRIDLSLQRREIDRELSRIIRRDATSFKVDCRRTDRTHPMYLIPDASKDTVDTPDEDVVVGGSLMDTETGSQTPLNPHIASLRDILMTYHISEPDLGYVQGMSDLLSPIYVVFDADESSSFWLLNAWMKTMNVNFLRDQSGMRTKLSTLQQLISAMDPELYRKLEITNSTSLFMCFRWLLINFKREFPFDDVIRLWDILFTDFYSRQFVLFVSLAILHSHRDVILRYLYEFDEVLKYANDLSQTIDLPSTLAQAEVLFLSFRDLVREVDDKASAASTELRRRRTTSKGESREPENSSVEFSVSDDLRQLLRNWSD